MSERLVTFEQEGAVGIVTLRRPEKFNALDIPMLRALEAALTEPAAQQSRALAQRARVLRQAFDHAVLLREAAALLHQRLPLPARDGTSRVAVLSCTGLRFEVPAGGQPGRATAESPARQTCRCRGGRIIPKAVLDILCVAATFLRKQPA